MDRSVTLDLLHQPLFVVFTVTQKFLAHLFANLLDGATIRDDGLRTLVGQRVCGGLQAHCLGQAFVRIGACRRRSASALRQHARPSYDPTPAENSLDYPRDGA